MIIYSNGDEHCSAACAVNDFEKAMDDKKYFYMGSAPHPDNIEESYSQHLANFLKCKTIVDSKVDADNQYIIDSTRAFLKENTNSNVFVLIGWSTFEREQWEHNDQKIFIQSALRTKLPIPIRSEYKQYIENLDYDKKTAEWHNKIHDFHAELQDQNIKHLFFNTYDHFESINKTHNWDDCYYSPYSESNTFWHWSINQGYKTKTEENFLSYFLEADAHHKWALHLIPYIAKLL